MTKSQDNSESSHLSNSHSKYCSVCTQNKPARNSNFLPTWTLLLKSCTFQNPKLLNQLQEGHCLLWFESSIKHLEKDSGWIELQWFVWEEYLDLFDQSTFYSLLMCLQNFLYQDFDSLWLSMMQHWYWWQDKTLVRLLIPKVRNWWASILLTRVVFRERS